MKNSLLVITMLVQIFVSNSFAAEVKITADDAAAGDYFGWDVSISGNYAIVGAPYNTVTYSYQGSAYIFYRNQGGADNWGQQAELTASDAAADDYLGYSVSISGDYAIVGADEDDDNGFESGSAYIFYRNQGGTDNWGQQKKLTSSDAVAGDYFGWSVSISGDYAIVGASDDDDNGDESGSAYIFYRNQGGTDNWGQQAKLIASDGAANDYFGYSVSVSGDYAIVGAPYNDDNGSGSGSAYIFYRNQGGTDNWGQQAKLTSNDAAAGDYFGWSVSISGDYAIVGASNDDATYSDQGSAYIFYRSGTTWSQQAKLTANDAAASNYFGTSVSISGDYALTGAYYSTFGSEGAGKAYSFLLSGTSWSQMDKQTASDGAAGDKFGASVSISGDYAIMGAYGDDDNGSSSGSAYIYESVQDLSLPVELTSFTASVDHSGSVILEWVTESEIDNLGFILERRAWIVGQGAEDWQEIASYITDSRLQGQGSVTYRTEYRYLDDTVEEGKTYDYRLSDVSYDGEKEYHGLMVLGIHVGATVPERFVLHPAYPNPFNPKTTIEFDLPEAQQVTVVIYDLSGREVATLTNREYSAGSHLVKWNAGDYSSGVYVYRLKAGAFTATGKLVLIK